jgi:CRP-like cAMP-binding protein
MHEGNEASIRVSALAAELSEDQIRALAAITKTHDLADGDVLIDKGDRDDRLFAVVSGALEVDLPDQQGTNTAPIVRLGPGAIAGELGFLQDMERTATVRAAGQTVVVSLRRAQLESTLDSDPLLTYRVMRAILRSVHQVVSNMNAHHSHLVNYIMS